MTEADIDGKSVDDPWRNCGCVRNDVATKGDEEPPYSENDHSGERPPPAADQQCSDPD
jgi:hypothetical protein